MKLELGKLRLSATDLGGYLNCRHLTQLDIAVAQGALKYPHSWDPLLDLLWARGQKHEDDYVETLKQAGLNIEVIPGVDIDASAVDLTVKAMQAGYDVIVQGALAMGQWAGRADVLRKVKRKSSLGNWSYEVIDTKLARTTKGATILQLSLYSEILADLQGSYPVNMHVVHPWTDFEPQSFRTADFGAYYRRVKTQLEATVAAGKTSGTYPDPVGHCDICAWRNACDKRRRDDDHPSLVAGITKIQIAELALQGITKLEELAVMPVPLDWKPGRGSVASFVRIREQARIQKASRDAGAISFELLPHQPGFGLSQLPPPSEGDIFLDFEGDPFVGEGGLEFLLGYHFTDSDGKGDYVGHWALTRQEEKAAFETFIDFIVDRKEQYPDLHIYHFGGYERGALTRLMGRYATREDELDQILRAKLLVDLLTIVRQGICAGVESYSIKKLEPIYAFTRDTALPDANLALTRFQTCLELDDAQGIEDEDRVTIESYNRDDCVSTLNLRNWLEQQRDALIALGNDVQRPEPTTAEPTEKIAEWLAKIGPLVVALSKDVPPDTAERTDSEHARWLLAQMLDWHRREDKATFWEKYRLSDLSEDELRDDKAGLADLEFVASVGGTAKCPIHRYRFSPQDSDIRPGNDLLSTGGQKYAVIEALSFDDLTIDIKKRQDSADVHANAVFAHDYFSPEAMQNALVRLAEYVVAHGIEGPGPYVAARALLLRSKPSIANDDPMRLRDEATLDAGKRIAPLLRPGILPIQGPPGTGKTFTGAHMVCELVRANKKVGIVANSHSVVRNFLNAVIEAAEETGTDIRCVQKPKEHEADEHRLRKAKKSADLFAALRAGCQVAGGATRLWSLPEAFETVDVLFVDEAAQMALANVLAVAHAAPVLILLGDPQQLDQPMQGTHPDGTGCSALHHLLQGNQTIALDQGMFLEETWRLHPNICAFTSELFYEDKLDARADLKRQNLNFEHPVGGAGIRYVPVQHSGNTNCSPEEAAMIATLVDDMLGSGASWTDRDKTVRPLELSDILIIAPYNAQVLEIQRRIPGANVGTVDKFQGREKPVAIYSLTTSSHADAPRGMEFLYSLNRLNVATSRARCISILVGSPDVFEAECKTPRQMQLANAFCRFLEMAQATSPDS